LGMIRLRSEDTAAAVAILERGISGSTDVESDAVTSMMYQLGVSFEMRNELAAAVEQWEKVSARNSNHADVENKLAYYADLRGDDLLRDLHIASAERLEELVDGFMHEFGIESETINSHNTSITDVVGHMTQGSFVGSKRLHVIMRLFRTSDMISDRHVRSLMARMSELKLQKGILLATSDITATALDIARAAEIEIYDKSGVSDLLHKFESESKQMNSAVS